MFNRYKDQLIVIGFAVSLIALVVLGVWVRNNLWRYILCS